MDGREGKERLNMANVNPYCNVVNVQTQIPRVLRNIDDSRAAITRVKITKECIKISSEMDTRFGAVGIDVPVNTTDNERIRTNLERIAVNGVCAALLKSISTLGEDNFALAELFEAQYYRDITFIENNGLNVDDEETDDAAVVLAKGQFKTAFEPLVESSSNPVNWGRW